MHNQAVLWHYPMKIAAVYVLGSPVQVSGCVVSSPQAVASDDYD